MINFYPVLRSIIHPLIDFAKSNPYWVNLYLSVGFYISLVIIAIVIWYMYRILFDGLTPAKNFPYWRRAVLLFIVVVFASLGGCLFTFTWLPSLCGSLGGYLLRVFMNKFLSYRP